MSTKSPKEVIDAALVTGCNKVALPSRDFGRFALLTVLAGVYIAFGGTLSVILGYGFPELTAGNPGLQKLLSGAAFPIGLILVVVLGAELFTGNNALLMPPLMAGKCSWRDVAVNWVLVYLGNFVGAIGFVYVFVYVTGLMSPEPYHAAIVKIAEAKVSMPWLTVMVKGIGANWCVCLAIWLAMACDNLIPATIGNIIGGALLVGCVHVYLHRVKS